MNLFGISSLLSLLPLFQSAAGAECDSGLKTDPFDCGLDSSVWISRGTDDPKSVSVSNGYLNMFVPDAVLADMWTKPGELNNVPRVYQALSENGDFDIKVTLSQTNPPNLVEKFNELGVYLRYGADNKFYRMSIFSFGSTTSYKFFLARIEGGSSDVELNVPRNTYPSDIRVVRDGSDVTFYWGTEETKTLTINEEIDGVGLFAANGGSAGNAGPNKAQVVDFTASFESFELQCSSAPAVECGGGAKADPHFKVSIPSYVPNISLHQISQLARVF